MSIRGLVSGQRSLSLRLSHTQTRTHAPFTAPGHHFENDTWVSEDIQAEGLANVLKMAKTDLL